MSALHGGAGGDDPSSVQLAAAHMGASDGRMVTPAVAEPGELVRKPVRAVTQDKRDTQ